MKSLIPAVTSEDALELLLAAANACNAPSIMQTAVKLYGSEKNIPDGLVRATFRLLTDVSPKWAVMAPDDADDVDTGGFRHCLLEAAYRLAPELFPNQRARQC